MELRVLNYFVTTAQEKNFTKAAQLLHISQPALSKQIKELENELGVTLFHRGSREITLTEEGNFLLGKGKDILKLVARTEKNICSSEEISGVVCIGMAESEGIELVFDAIKQLTENYPQVEVNVYSGMADELIEKMECGVLDFGIVLDTVDKGNYDSLLLPGKSRWGILAHKNSKFSGHTSIDATDLNTESLIISAQPALKNQLGSWLGKSLNNFHIAATYNSIYNAALMVEKYIGYAICMSGVINTENTELKFIPLSPTLNSRFSVIWKNTQPLSKASSTFLELLKAEMNKQKRSE